MPNLSPQLAAAQARRPGVAGPLIAAAARALLSSPLGYQSQARGPGYFDGVGLVRHAVGVGLQRNDLADTTYPTGGPTVDDAALLVTRWGLRRVHSDAERVQSGDVLLFALPYSTSLRQGPVGHLAVVTGRHPEAFKMAQAYPGRAPVESWLQPWWAERLVAVYRAVPPVPGYAARAVAAPELAVAA